MGIRGTAAALIVAGLALAGCASEPLSYSQMPPIAGRSVVQDTREKPQQCAPYARAHSRIKIFGDAYTWWDQAAGRYPRGGAPSLGSVMVLHDYAGPTHGHVAVVRALVNPREIRVDHANWLDDGSVFLNNPVMDVSAGNDWSVVRVFNLKTGAWGSHLYPVQGFIGSQPADGERPNVVADAGGGMGSVTLAPEN